MTYRARASILIIFLSSACRRAALDSSMSVTPDAKAFTSTVERSDSIHERIEKRRVLDTLLRIKGAVEAGQTVVELALLLAEKPIAMEKPGWWKLNLAMDEAFVIVGADGSSGRIAEADVVLPLSLNLRLIDLTGDFGISRVIHEGRRARPYRSPQVEPPMLLSTRTCSQQRPIHPRLSWRSDLIYTKNPVVNHAPGSSAVN